MRLVVLAKSSLVHKNGGMEVALAHLRAGLSGRGHEVLVLTTRHPSGVREERWEEGGVLYLHDAPSGRYSSSWWRESVAAISRLHSASRVDCIISISMAGYGYARWGRPTLGIPMVSRVTGDYFAILRNHWEGCRTPRDVLAFIVKALPEWVIHYGQWYPRLLRGSDRIVAVSDETAEALRRQFRLPPGKFAVIPNGSDTTMFRPDAERRRIFRERLGFPGDVPVLLMVSVLTRQKGIHLGIQAFRALLDTFPGSFLVVAGDGPELPSLRASAHDGHLAERIRFVGSVANEDLAGYYNAADLLLFPTSRVEGFPWVLAEAMASGLPVIASAIGGVPSAVTNGVTGVLVNPHDAGAITRACLTLLGNPALGRKMGAVARERAVSEFNRDVMVERYLAVVSSVSGRRDA